jgi:DNA-binding response OmpR family regulator
MAKILIIEDERSIRQALRFELEEDGHEVFDASDYSEAVSACSAFDCDLIISDLFLDQGNGLQILNIINHGKKDIPFIGITAFPETQLAIKAKSLLKDRFMAKPFLTHAFKAKVKEVLGQKNYTIPLN